LSEQKPAGPTINEAFDRLPSELLERAALLPASTLHEAGGRIGALPPEIRQVIPNLPISGQVVTVHSPAGDNLWIHRAIYVANPGDVLVVQIDGANNAESFGYWGEIMTVAAKARGLGGLVINGCVRDQSTLQRHGFPIFSRGFCIRGTGKDHGATGFINYPLRIADLIVHPGDLVVGDADGLVCIPRDQVVDVVDESESREAKEADVIERLLHGERTLELYQF
jgi:4-hydroxy-4-methyl-2-oxoglutarate aldolase